MDHPLRDSPPCQDPQIKEAVPTGRADDTDPDLVLMGSEVPTPLSAALRRQQGWEGGGAVLFISPQFSFDPRGLMVRVEWSLAWVLIVTFC